METIPATVTIPDYLVGIWKADPVHSEIAFSVRHLMISKARGRFTAFRRHDRHGRGPPGLLRHRDDRPGVRRHRQRDA
ncbi:YceI family protein [Streptomyces sp. NPDC096132]|uniref:YceI family protein n=1 Tax=Streptomyces sp. NPDC096132 TaxID=3366075 RepID=UPI00380AEA93